MAKTVATVDPGESKESESRAVPIIIEKYLALRQDIAGPLKRVFVILYKGQTHLIPEWDEIINRRISRPAD
jgi:hypothetical protein